MLFVPMRHQAAVAMLHKCTEFKEALQAVLSNANVVDHTLAAVVLSDTDYNEVMNTSRHAFFQNISC